MTDSNIPYIILDAHQDIAYNFICYQRDFRLPALKKRHYEDNSPESIKWRGIATVGLPDELLGRVGIVFTTLYVNPAWSPFGVDNATYETPHEAYQHALRQMDYYHQLADSDDRIRLIRNQRELQTVLESWQADKSFEEHKLGLVILMEGADPILEPPQLEEWYERGVRIVGPAWSETRYAGGTWRPGPLTPLGFELLDVMAGYKMALDLSHMTDEGYMQAIDRYEGALIASHSNPRRFRDSVRMLSDEMIMRLAERNGVIGVVPAIPFFAEGWKKGDSRQGHTIEKVTEIIDYICQLTGSARHVGIGTDWDGGFGVESLPLPMDTISDLWLMNAALEKRGYDKNTIQDILCGNFLRILRSILPES